MVTTTAAVITKTATTTKSVTPRTTTTTTRSSTITNAAVVTNINGDAVSQRRTVCNRGSTEAAPRAVACHQLTWYCNTIWQYSSIAIECTIAIAS